MGEDLSAFAKKRKSKKIRRFVFLGVMLAVLLGTAAYFALENYFVVKDILIQESALYSREDMIASLAIEQGTPLYQLKKSEIINTVQDRFPYLVDVKVKYVLPDKIKIRFEEKFGEIAIVLGNDLFAVDRNMNVLAKESATSQIPRIRLLAGDVKRCVVGEKLTFIDENSTSSLTELLEQMDREGFLADTRQIDIRDAFHIAMDYGGRFQILLGDSQDLHQKFAMVREVMKDLGEYASGRIDIADPDNAYVKLYELES